MYEQSTDKNKLCAMSIFSGGYMAHEIVYGLNTVGNFRLLNFATGGYSCKCCVCGKGFIGDKRAVMCLACALKAVEESCHSTQQLQAKIRAISDIIEVSESGLVTADFAALKQRLRELSAVQ